MNTQAIIAGLKKAAGTIVGAVLFLAPVLGLGATNIGEKSFILDVVISVPTVAIAAAAFAGVRSIKDIEGKDVFDTQKWVAWGGFIGLIEAILIYFAA
jgi:hypothetical protein